jgi:hypothetical protein
VDAVANYPQHAKAEPLFPRRPRRLGSRSALLSLLGVFGVLAFILSATSPDDDDIQQEFSQTSRAKQCVLANYKALSNIRAFRICAVRSVLAPPMPQFASYYVTSLVAVPDAIKAEVYRSRTGDRSPPTKSS